MAETGAIRQNVEIKARAPAGLDRLRDIARRLSGSDGEILEQEDVFFHVPKGRLKLRILRPDYGELIYYERADEASARLSSYSISVTTEPAALLRVLTRALGQRAVVRKRRELYLVGQTRIHLDSVEGLGDFIELEFVMRPDDAESQGQRVVADLMSQLGIAASDLIDAAYVDMLGLV